MLATTTLQQHLHHGDVRLNQQFDKDELKERSVDDVQMVECTLNAIQMHFACLGNWSLQDTDLYNSLIVETHFDTMVSSGLWHKTTMEASTLNSGRFVDQEFSGCHFEKRTIFTRTTFKKVIFVNCVFENVRWDNCFFSDVLFKDCVFRGVHSTTRPQLDSQVKFSGCSFTQTRYKTCEFLKRKNPYGIQPSHNASLSTTFEKSDTAGTLFTGCTVDGLDYTDLRDCIFDSGGLFNEDNDGDNVIDVDAKDIELIPLNEIFPEDNSKSLARTYMLRNTDELRSLTESIAGAAHKDPLDDDDDDDDYEYYGYGYYGCRRNWKPKNVGTPRPYRFFTSGFAKEKEAGA